MVHKAVAISMSVYKALMDTFKSGGVFWLINILSQFHIYKLTNNNPFSKKKNHA